VTASKSPRSRTRKAKPSGKVDRRVQRTRDALGNALIDLMREQPFESIRLQDVLARAKVGRSTFYEHFKDKDDLFESDADDFFGWIANALPDRSDPSERVVPVREFLEHVKQMGSFVDNLVESGMLHDNFSLGQEHFARAIERRLAQIPRAASLPAADRPAFAQAQAGAFMSLARWWIRRGMKERPEEMDALFHRQFWSGAGTPQ
jgi:AcrR family transcriptional regulator